MVVPPQLASFSPLEALALERARELKALMGVQGLQSLFAELELEDPSSGGQRFTGELRLAGGVAELRILRTRLRVELEALDRPDLLEAVAGGAFLPRGASDPEMSAADPVSGVGRHALDDPLSGGEGPAWP